MAKNVKDLALMLNASVGHQTDDPLSFDHAGPSFLAALKETVSSNGWLLVQILELLLKIKKSHESLKMLLSN